MFTLTGLQSVCAPDIIEYHCIYLVICLFFNLCVGGLQEHTNAYGALVPVGSEENLQDSVFSFYVVGSGKKQRSSGLVSNVSAL